MAATADQIGGWYQQYLGRPARPDEVNNWLNGTYGADPQNQIQSSGEAQSYRGRQQLVGGLGAETGLNTAPTAGRAPLEPSAGDNPLTRNQRNQDGLDLPGGGGPFNTTGNTGVVGPNMSGDNPPPQPAPSPTLTPTIAGAGQVGPVPNRDVLMGFDQSRFSDPASMGTLKYYIGQLLSAGMSGDQAVAAANARFGPNAASWDAVNQNIGLDKTRDGYIGLRPRDRNNPTPNDNVWQWMTYNNAVTPPGGFKPGDINSNDPSTSQTGPGGGGPVNAGPSGGLLSPTPIAGAGGPGGGGLSGVSGPTNDYMTSIRQMLLSQLGGLSSPETANSSDIQPALDAYDVRSKRDQQDQRDALAEQYYAEGNSGGGALDTGAFKNAVAQNAEKAGEARASFAGNTVYNASMAKRQHLVQMLQTATQYGLTDQAQQIQQQIAMIDAALQEQELTQQNTQANNNLGFNYANLIANMNRNTLLSGLGG